MVIQIRTHDQPQFCLILKEICTKENCPQLILGALGMKEKVSQTSEHLARVGRGLAKSITTPPPPTKQN